MARLDVAGKLPWYRRLTVQVLMAIALGVTLGVVVPEFAVELQVLGQLFIRAIKMVVAPIVFLTVVLGIGSIGNLKQVGRVGGKALLYFEVVTTLALLIGVVVANVVQPGAGVTVPSDATAEVAKYADTGFDWRQFLLHLVPESAVGAFAAGEVLQVLFFAVLAGVALSRLPSGTRLPIVAGLEGLSALMFRVLEIIMRAAPLGALGGMAYTIGRYGVTALLPLAKLMGSVYLTMALFIFVVLGGIAWLSGFKLLGLLRLIRDEILIVLGTSSSEAALPRMLEKMERIGCSRSVVGLVIPTGYSFNLDGTSIYLSMAAIFLAQVYGVQLSIVQQLTLLGILMITSKGAAGVTGSGFVVLGGTLAAMRVIPVEGMALLLGVDRFMSEARAITNLIGNGVATMVIARHEGEFDEERYQQALEGNWDLEPEVL
jgi:aerobic C4-dicarboxylate transport protein